MEAAQVGHARGDPSVEPIEVGERVECCVEMQLESKGELEKRCSFTSEGYSYCWVAGTVSARVGGGWDGDSDPARVDRRKVRVVLDVQDKKWGGGGHTQFHEMVVGLERVRKLLATDPTCARFRDYARVK